MVLQHTTINLQNVNFWSAFAMIGGTDMTNEICVHICKRRYVDLSEMKRKRVQVAKKDANLTLHKTGSDDSEL